LDVGGVGQPGPRRESACELGLSPCPEGATKFSNIAYYDLPPLQGGFDKNLTQAKAWASMKPTLSRSAVNLLFISFFGSF
jgi:hypothetical protein